MNQEHSDRIKLGLKRKKHNMWIRRTLEWTAMVNIALISSLTINNLFTFRLQPPLTVVHNPKTEVHASEQVKDLSVQEHVWKIMTEEYGLSFDEAQHGMAIVQCESKWNKEAEQFKRNTQGVDRGLFQINSHFHPEVPASCAYDVYCGTRAAMKIYQDWGGWDAWACNKLL